MDNPANQTSAPMGSRRLRATLAKRFGAKIHVHAAMIWLAANLHLIHNRRTGIPIDASAPD